MGKIRKTKV